MDLACSFVVGFSFNSFGVEEIYARPETEQHYSEPRCYTGGRNHMCTTDISLPDYYVAGHCDKKFKYAAAQNPFYQSACIVVGVGLFRETRPI